MVIRRVLAPRIDFGALRRELGLPEDFPAAAQREADAAAAAPLPAVADRTDIPFVTVDPATSRDLDQAMHLARRPGGGFRVRYAIADVFTHVRPGGELEAETWRRGQTVYLPDGNVPLHPHTLSEGAASLLPDADRAAVLWTIDLDADGGTVAVTLERARVRSRAKLDYSGVQRDADAGRLPDPIALLPEIGALLTARGLRRGAINLPLPEQDVEPDGDGWRLVLRGPGPMEEHNAQISLLTGMAAADLMLAGRIGLLRTMPPPRPEAVDRLRLAAGPLGVPWPADTPVGTVLVGLDASQPRAAAFVDQAAELMRGAAYTAFDGQVPEQPEHGGVAAAYAHVTAPLRRLADRYATELCLALHEGREVPEHVRAALPQLPEVMATTDRTASAATRGAVELAEAVLLAHRVGETFEAAVLDVDEPRPAGNGRAGRPPGGTVALDEPPVRGRCTGDLPLGERVRVRLTAADPTQRKVAFERA
ncbi:RNB domain-containing ribonuclease [Micromonospora sp. A3M-1-15]|uniref:RNB domain-containing ribonuclease n=1 Tax=Micromonospora sp. A3M-1-15 TaxID=2962035 RepID=UPI0020B85D71|nr:RNB domain-containing ribonuclease [Micromonospora sp. A3M-1-15]MCP3786048.1 RNB domain-containing ribonuclease [Micromonospora sp. A3M-1-15]